MRIVVGRQSSVVSLCGRLCCLLLSAFCLLSCSVPNLEDPDCTKARDVVREFYSYHFGHNLAYSEEDLNARKDYLTPEFLSRVRHAPGVDPFTRMEDPPKAFRVGECRVIEPGKRTGFEVLLFWKDDVKSVQRSIRVEAVQLDGRWLIDKVSN